MPLAALVSKYPVTLISICVSTRLCSADACAVQGQEPIDVNFSLTPLASYHLMKGCPYLQKRTEKKSTVGPGSCALISEGMFSK